MKARGLLALLAALGVLGLLSMLLVLFGKPSREVLPSSLSSDPGGTLALYRLLQEEGIPVKRLYEKPRGQATDIGVVIYFRRPASENDLPEAPVTIVADVPSSVTPPSKMERYGVRERMDAYANVRSVLVPSDLAEFDRNALIRTAGGHALAQVAVAEEGVEIRVPAGEMWLNQYLDQEDNAEHALATIRLALEPGKTVVFPEYLYGIGGERWLFRELGPAYASLVVQFLLLFGLWLYSNLRRFGYPIEEPIRQPGSEEHILAFAYALERAKAYDVLLDSLLERARRLAARRYRLPRDLPIEELAARLPEPLRRLLTEVTLLPPKPKHSVALDLIRRLDEELTRHESGALG
jgi:hypothetical protein